MRTISGVLLDLPEREKTDVRIRNSRDLGAAIRAIRKRRGYTLEQTAGVTGVGIRFLSELENGKPTAELDKALRVAALLGIGLGASDPEGHLDRVEKVNDLIKRHLGRRDAAAPTNAEAPEIDERRVRAAAARLAAASPDGSPDEKLVRRVVGELKRRRRSHSPERDAEDES